MNSCVKQTLKTREEFEGAAKAAYEKRYSNIPATSATQSNDIFRPLATGTSSPPGIGATSDTEAQIGSPHPRVKLPKVLERPELSCYS